MTKTSSRDTILRLFRRHAPGFISGEAISRELAVSRTAVWKQIRALRDLGYAIEAIPSRGYRMVAVPDTFLAANLQNELDTLVVGRKVVCLDEVDSTNGRAAALADDGAEDGTVVVAERQSAGKGRLGRRWESPAGINLYLSVVLRPPILPWDAPQLTFLSAVAVARAVAAETGLEPEVKWPNDILLAGRKVAGLLNEMRAETEGVHHVVLGIGVNLNMMPDQFPADLRAPATSLAIETGTTIARTAFARRLLGELDALYREYLDQGFEPLRLAWQGFFRLVGRPVRIEGQDPPLEGVVEGIDGEGALLLRTSGGTLERVLAGDVKPLGEEGR